MDGSTLLTIAMIAMMAVVMGAVLVGAARAIRRRRRGPED